MPVFPPSMRGSMAKVLGNDPARMRRTGSPTRNQIVYGTVGHEDPNPQYVRLEGGQPYVEVTIQPEGDEVSARVGLPGAGDKSGWYIPLEFGCRVIMELLDGDPQRAVITGRLYDETCAMPGTVAGVLTGALGVSGAVVAPAPNWQFVKTASQQMLAIETGTNGDVLIHAGASVHIKTGFAGVLPGQIHLDGTTRLGKPPATDPIGSQVGPAGVNSPAIPAVPAALDAPPIPLPGAPAPVPFLGQATSIIRAKDGVQSYVLVDPVFWAWITAVGVHPLIIGVIGLPPPVVMNAVHAGQYGPGALHTASDPAL